MSRLNVAGTVAPDHRRDKPGGSLAQGTRIVNALNADTTVATGLVLGAIARRGRNSL
jgi:hypothetical protein